VHDVKSASAWDVWVARVLTSPILSPFNRFSPERGSAEIVLIIAPFSAREHSVSVHLAVVCLCLALGGIPSAAGPLEAALVNVRDTKKDLYAPATSSVLGPLPDADELAAAQPSRRFRPRTPQECSVVFDGEKTARIARDYKNCTFIFSDRQRIPMIPVGITGAYVFDMFGRSELVVVMTEDGSPADGRLKPYDLLIGANGRLFEDETDPRPVLGAALAESQTPELDGKLTLQVIRDGVFSNVVIDLEDSEPYSLTWPHDCPKSRRIAAAALECVKNHKNVTGRDGLWTTLFLLAADDPGALDFARRRIYRAADPEGKPHTGANWTWLICYPLIGKCEYYLLTGDKTVLPSIQSDVNELERRQFHSGGWGNRVPPGYGEVNNVGYSTLIGLFLAKECGAEVDEDKIALAIRYYGKFCGVGTPYGDNIPPMVGGGGLNGVNALNAVVFNLLGEHELAERTARGLCYTWPMREKGHSESTFSFAWGPIGAALAPEDEYHMFMNNMLWYYELMRTRDGAFAFSGSTRFGFPRETTALTGLFFFQEDPRLRILGGGRGPFSHPVPGFLAGAIRAFRDGDLEHAREEAQKRAQSGKKENRALAEALLRAIHDRETHVAYTLAAVQENIDAGDRETAGEQLDALERLLGGTTPETAALRSAGPSSAAAAEPGNTGLKTLLTEEMKTASMGLRRPEPPAMLWRTILPFADQDLYRERRPRYSDKPVARDELTRSFNVESVEGEWLRILLKNEEGGEVYLNGQRLAVIQPGRSSRNKQLTPSAQFDEANAYVLWPKSLAALREGENTLVLRALPNTHRPMNIALQVGPYVPDSLKLDHGLASYWKFEERDPWLLINERNPSAPALVVGRATTCPGVTGSALLLEGNPDGSDRLDEGRVVTSAFRNPTDAEGTMDSMTVSLWVKLVGKSGYVDFTHGGENDRRELESGWRIKIGTQYAEHYPRAMVETITPEGAMTLDARLSRDSSRDGFHNLVMRYEADEKRLTLFCDGVRSAEKVLAGAPLLDESESRAFIKPSSKGAYAVDETAMWNRALSDQEIIKLFTQAEIHPTGDGVQADKRVQSLASAIHTLAVMVAWSTAGHSMRWVKASFKIA
jgi:hypothetical protein